MSTPDQGGHCGLTWCPPSVLSKFPSVARTFSPLDVSQAYLFFSPLNAFFSSVLLKWSLDPSFNLKMWSDCSLLATHGGLSPDLDFWHRCSDGLWLLMMSSASTVCSVSPAALFMCCVLVSFPLQLCPDRHLVRPLCNLECHRPVPLVSVSAGEE